MTSPPDTAGSPSPGLLAAIRLAAIEKDEPHAIVSRCPLPAAVIDLDARRLIATNPPFACLLPAPEFHANPDAFTSVLGQPKLIEAVADLLKCGALDTCSSRRRLRRPDGTLIDVDNWIAVTSTRDRHVAVWVLAPVQRDDVAYARRQSAVSWPSDSFGLTLGSFNVDWQIARVTTDGEQLFGCPVNDLIGSSFLSFVHPEDAGELIATLAQALGGRGGAGTDLRLRHSRDEWRTSWIVVSPLVGRPLRFGFIVAPRTPARSGLAERNAALERHLWRIAQEVEDAGVTGGLARVPDLRDVPALAQLSGRQWEILKRLLQGERAPEIASSLFVSQSTVRNHLAEVYRKLGVHSQVELLAMLRSRSRSG